MSLASSFRWSLHQMAVNTTSVNGAIEEEMHINQLKGFEIHGQNKLKFHLKTSDLHSHNFSPTAESENL
jgi:hypothetical protein